MSKRVASGLLPLISVDRKAPKALHAQIYDTLRLSIVEGRLSPGQQIPSTRLLAAELGVSRLPVLNAYAQLLAEGYLQAKTGSGTIVSTMLPGQFTSPAPMGRRAAQSPHGRRDIAERTRLLPAHQAPTWIRNPGAFGVGQVAYDQFPIHIWSRIASRRSKSMNMRSFSYGDLMGSTDLRESVAAYLRTARSVRCDVDQILIVSGSQQAIELCAQVLINPGDPVWVEEPGYPFSREIFALAGALITPVPVDGDGLNVNAGLRKCRAARVAIVTPSHQFPLGSTMSASRRIQLLKWAQESGSWIIEDDYDSEYRYESSPIASLQGLDTDDRVIYVGTFSKVMFPSLRLGYIVVPRDLLQHFRDFRRAKDLGPPVFMQEVLAEFIGEGHFERHIRRMRLLYQERRDVLINSLTRELGGVGRIHGAKAGMYFAITFPTMKDDKEIARYAASQKLWLWPLSSTYCDRVAEPGFVLGFGGISTSSIPLAVRKFAALPAIRGIKA